MVSQGCRVSGGLGDSTRWCEDGLLVCGVGRAEYGVSMFLFEVAEVEKEQRWHGDGCSGAPLAAAAAGRRIDTEGRRARAGMAIACQCLWRSIVLPRSRPGTGCILSLLSDGLVCNSDLK